MDSPGGGAALASSTPTPAPPPDGDGSTCSATPELLRSRGAQLLRQSVDIDYEEPVHPAWLDILDALTPDEARLLRHLRDHGPVAMVDVRTQLMSLDALRAGALDEYALFRDGWLQRRNYQIDDAGKRNKDENSDLPPYLLEDEGNPTVPMDAMPTVFPGGGG